MLTNEQKEKRSSILIKKWSSWFEPKVEKSWIFEQKWKRKEKIKLPTVQMRMFDIQKDIRLLGFPFIQ